MSGPPPTWNDPDWPKTLGGWLLTIVAFMLLVGSLLAFAYLVSVASR